MDWCMEVTKLVFDRERRRIASFVNSKLGQQATTPKTMPPENGQVTQELTFGEKLVGKTFNPSRDPRVDRIKALAAEMADIVFEEYKVAGNGKPIENGRLRDILAEGAFSGILNGQMNAVKFITNEH